MRPNHNHKLKAEIKNIDSTPHRKRNLSQINPSTGMPRLEFSADAMLALQNYDWPGDMSEIISPPFEAGGVHTFVPPFISVGHVDNIAYALGSVSNNITFQITLTPYYRMMIRYYIQDNGTDWVSGYFYSTNSTSEVTMFFDGLPLGSHNILVTFITDWDSTSTEFTILVYQTNTTSTTTSTTTTYSTQNTTDFSYLFHSILIGISIGSSLVIVTVVILTINLRHKHSRQITSCSDFLQVSLSLS